MRKKVDQVKRGISIPVRGTSTCKVPEVGMTVTHLGSRKKGEGAEQTEVVTNEVGEV